MDNLNLKIEAAVFKRLIKHLRENTDIQNIDISKEEARNYIYGMDYDEWKSKYQK